MAVRFVIGRAGVGKTHHRLESIREQLRHDPINGPRLMVLVPEQASLQMERGILHPSGQSDSAEEIPGAHRAEVLSFRRLAYRVLDSVGNLPVRALTEPARTMVVRHLLVRHSKQLRYYGRVGRSGGPSARFGGFVEKVSSTIAELMEEAVEPGELAAVGLEDRPAVFLRYVLIPAGIPPIHHLLYLQYG